MASSASRNARQDWYDKMTTLTFPNSTTTQSTGISPSCPYSFFPPHKFIRTELPAHFKCKPETRIVSVITWEPVILPLLERLAELRWLPEEQRWPGADWPTEEAFQNAGKFTERLPGTMKAAPYISLADDGEVNFAWTRDGMLIDLGFYGTGAYSFYARGRDGDEWFGDDISVMATLPEELRVYWPGNHGCFVRLPTWTKARRGRREFLRDRWGRRKFFSGRS